MTYQRRAYSGFTTFWKAIGTLVAALGLVGAGAVFEVPLPGEDAPPQLWLGWLIVVVPAGWRALENFRKNGSGSDSPPLWTWPVRLPWDASVVLLCAVLAAAGTLQGCALLGGPGVGGPFRPGVGDHSMVEMEFDEKTPDGGRLQITFRATGDAAGDAKVQYTGEAGTLEEVTVPWNLLLDASGSVDSPQATLVAEGYAELLKEIPDTASSLAAQVATVMSIPGIGSGPDGEGTGGVRDVLLQFVLERFLSNRLGDGGDSEGGGLLEDFNPLDLVGR